MSNNETYTKPEPVRLLGAITSGLIVFFGGLTTVAGLSDNKVVATISGLGLLVTAAVNIAKDEFVRKNVVPVIDTAAYRNTSGNVVAGPAAAMSEGAPAAVTAPNQVFSQSIVAGTAVAAEDVVKAVQDALRRQVHKPKMPEESGVMVPDTIGADESFQNREREGNL